MFVCVSYESSSLASSLASLLASSLVSCDCSDMVRTCKCELISAAISERVSSSDKRSLQIALSKSWISRMSTLFALTLSTAWCKHSASCRLLHSTNAAICFCLSFNSLSERDRALSRKLLAFAVCISVMVTRYLNMLCMSASSSLATSCDSVTTA